MKTYPMFEQDGVKYYGSGSYERAYFDTEIGEIRFIEVIHYNDFPLSCFFQHENGQKYFGSVSWKNYWKDWEWSYILVPISEEDYQDLKNQRMTADLPFENASVGYRVVVGDDDEKDAISEVNPRDYEEYEHQLNKRYLPK